MGPSTAAFGGNSVDTNSILVKYTFNGDADLNGKIDANDYFQIDDGFIADLTGYRNGDFDYNGVIDSDDYFLIDSAFGLQNQVVLSAIAAVPEPSSMAWNFLGLGGMLIRRPKH